MADSTNKAPSKKGKDSKSSKQFLILFLLVLVSSGAIWLYSQNKSLKKQVAGLEEKQKNSNSGDLGGGDDTQDTKNNSSNSGAALSDPEEGDNNNTSN